MKDTVRKDIIFTREKLENIFLILEYSAISLLDIRHNLISPKEALRYYTLPCSAFLFTNPGKAEVLLEDKSYQINHFSSNMDLRRRIPYFSQRFCGVCMNTGMNLLQHKKSGSKSFFTDLDPDFNMLILYTDSLNSVPQPAPFVL